MIAKISAVFICMTLIVVGINVYISPDDLANCQELVDKSPCNRAEAVVVVSGGDTEARTMEAVRLYQEDWAPLIIASGAAADKSGPSNALAMKELAVTNGVPSEAIIIEELSETTKQNATEVKQIIESNNIKDIILVTSGYHMRRAQLEFSTQLPDVKVRSHPVSDDKQWGRFWWLTPWGWQLAISEIVKIILFAIGGSR